MEENKPKFKIGDFVKKQKAKGVKGAKPINLEALVNSGRVRVVDKNLKTIEDKSSDRKLKK